MKSSLSTRYARLTAANRHEKLARHPEMQAEAIAHHYTRLAALAMNLTKLVEIRRYGGVSVSTDAAIAMIMEDIKEAHLQDLGIPLEWPAAIPDQSSRDLADDQRAGRPDREWPDYGPEVGSS